ncbi:lipid-binding SYLF domain-containing protein [Salinisphaera sp.]|uniref:lipid-binding SYLF domain-containing protein n=1 Tax=Salinisphaera sp. TaxID=1914330 RepID=UPI002D798D76|nr:lipid-binding SYLF domain-containing protein [Salinisphaera sp.]HET7313692.1 lipid-binding SYLF domain-containing protein [Salinisphaera sp.]
MQRSLRLVATVAAIALVAGCATTGQQNYTQKLQAQAALAGRAATVLQRQLLQPSRHRIPRSLVEQARCIAVFPKVTQAGFIIGGQRGRGLISCRQRSGDFTNAPPAVYTLSALSIGLQAGAAERAVVLLFTTQQSVRAVLDSLVKLGSQVSVSAGPTGYDRSVNSAAPIVAYGIARKGLYAGISLGGARVSFDTDANTAIYGPDPDPRQVLLQTDNVPQSMQTYVRALESFTSRARP